MYPIENTLSAGITMKIITFGWIKIYSECLLRNTAFQIMPEGIWVPLLTGSLFLTIIQILQNRSWSAGRNTFFYVEKAFTWN